MKFAASPSMLAYFNTIETELNRAIELASRAKAKGSDPTPYIEIPIAKDLADRVEKLMSIEGVAKKLRELENTMSREEAALQAAIAVAKGEIKMFNSRRDAIEAAVRVAMAVLTEGVVAAPIEGIAKIDLAKNDDGTDYIRIYYAGPIRSAGGTAQALSVLAADYIRANLGIAPFVPRPEEVERYVEEITAYRRVANLQYLPSDDEIRLIVKNCPICIDGEPTEEAEVEGRRDLQRIETNRIRGGMALVIAEGIALKAPKVKKHVDKLKLGGWDWLDKFIVTVKTDDTSKQLKPKDKYLQDLIAGRPVFSYPSKPGGFRLRYGRGRNTSFAAAGINPATMVLMDDFIAAGTQIKVERPGKAAGIGPVDTIDGPTVRLFNGDVINITTIEEAHRLRPSVQKILDIGEILINFGDFLENNHPLVPSSYCYEWWLHELALKTSVSEHGDLRYPGQQKALFLSDIFKVPLHPEYTYLWHDISIEDYSLLADYIHRNGKYSDRLSFPLDEKIKAVLEALLVPHIVREKQIIISEALPLIRCLGLDTELHRNGTACGKDVLETVSKASGITIRARAPIRIGARMGRPEKSDKREMKPAPHVLFPIGGAGGKRRSLVEVKDYVDDDDGDAEKSNGFRDNEIKTGLTFQKGKVGKISVQIGERVCPDCRVRTFKNRCGCGKFTHPVQKCPVCNIEIPSGGTEQICPKCRKDTTCVVDMDIDFLSEYQKALDNLRERDIYTPKGVLGLTSKNKTPEPLEKGVLRAKHDVVIFKDGTVRYDLSDLPLTHIKPAELGVTISKMKELGYDKDTYGNPLTDVNQVIELRVQDIVVSKDCAEYLLKTAQFIDDLLTRYYKVEPYYNIDKIDDLVGKLVIGLAPHTSAGVLARLVGFTTASVGYGHPFFHAAKRRNCFHGDEKVLIKRNEDFELLTIRELVESNLNDKIERDDFGTEYSKVEGLKTFAFNIKTKKFELSDITHVSKHIAPEKLLELRTKRGKKIVVTQDHLFPDRSGKKVKAKDADELLIPWNIEEPITNFDEDVFIDKVVGKKEIVSRDKYVYNLTVDTHHTLICSGITTFQCDGDEDCVMLLMDGLLNFSRSYLPDRRGGQMDAPLVLTSRIDPNEVDKETHNVDVLFQYPLAFFEATLKYANPKDVVNIMDTVSGRLGTPAQYEGFGFTHDTANIAAGPKNSAYKTLGTMIEKMDAQLGLARKIAAVDPQDVAERVINSHFLPDLIGNLRSFSKQKVRCTKCNAKYRRPPLQGSCPRCGGNIVLTVHEGSVRKYLETSLRIADEYNVRQYTKQRLELLDLEMKSLFESDKVKQKGLADFM